MKFWFERFGSDAAKKHLGEVARRSKAVLGQAADRAAEMLRDDTKRLPPVSASRTGYGAKGIPVAPKYGGTLRQSISKKRIAALATGVFPKAKYGVFVHEGTRKMPARPFFEWALESGTEAKVDAMMQKTFDDLVNGKQ